MEYIFKIKSIRNNLFLLLVIFVVPSFTDAATLFITPRSNEVKVGDTFSVLIDTDSQGVAINAATADISFDNNLLSVQSVGFSNSIFTIWPEEPNYSNTTGNIHFSGGLYSPGWNGSIGAILRVTFKAKAAGQTKLTFANTSILANDGIGTNIITNSLGSSINISKALPVTIENVPVKTTIVATSTVEKIVELFTIPVIVNIPDQLIEGSQLSFNGDGVSNGQIFVYVQKGKNSPEITQINTKSSGEFDFNYSNPVETGYYKIWARNISIDGIMSTSSDVSYVEVLGVSGYKINNYFITFKEVIYLLLIVSFIFFIFWLITLVLYFKNKQKKLITKKIKEKKTISKVG